MWSVVTLKTKCPDVESVVTLKTKSYLIGCVRVERLTATGKMANIQFHHRTVSNSWHELTDVREVGALDSHCRMMVQIPVWAINFFPMPLFFNLMMVRSVSINSFRQEKEKQLNFSVLHTCGPVKDPIAVNNYCPGESVQIPSASGF